MRQQISAIQRLQSLPPVFRGADLTVRFQWTSKKASHYLYLWKQRGLVSPLGGHSDVFANLLMNRHADWEKALLMAMPSAIVMGIEALRQAGWTTQVPRLPSVAVNSKHAVYSAEHFEINAYDPEWFETVRTGILPAYREGLPVLAPAWALADMLRKQTWGVCGLWPDDIEWAEMTDRDEVQWGDAWRAFGLPQAPLHSFIEASR